MSEQAEPRPTASGAPVEAEHPAPSLVRDMYWVVPLLSATLVVTVIFFYDLGWGASVAQVLSFPLGVAGFVASLLVVRHKDLVGPLVRKPNQARRVSALVAVAVLLAGSLTAFGLWRFGGWGGWSGKVRIGVNGELPGWSFPGGGHGDLVGFDVDVAKSLGNGMDFEAVLVPLGTGSREEALDSGLVDMVVANFSITDDREKLYDFSGPYFQDKPGVILHKGKQAQRIEDLKGSVVCVPAGARAAERFGAQLPDLQVTPGNGLADCMQKFCLGRDAVTAVSTDAVILQAYLPNWSCRDQIDGVQVLPGDEYYGVGLPRDSSPGLCRAVSDALRRFVQRGWDDSYEKHLHGIDKRGRRPSLLPSSRCDDRES
ncbi:transporter substrate-binding domain-containing protein [Actinokineospora sp. NBRC 105648]|uniref:transporter substrate-binding domain-containing protein n=1 Tax=Actinokineospora sp. NBRC 105648 TaxID=3032206 RepID=UPI0024A4587D|nr:transporter substrate-binding domain-containing protein [Actinokineospora sp. NBRC 105648]GLZ40332.1 hypothetical protein Acsp05_39560 [Actinokineospora sp. NBRC 105648]